MVSVLQRIFVTSVVGLIIIGLDSVWLWLSTKIFKLKDTSFATAFKMMVIVGGINLIVDFIGQVINLALPLAILSFLAVSVFLAMFLIKKWYDLAWRKAVLV